MSTSELDKGWIIGFTEARGVFTKNKIKIKRKTKKGEKVYLYSNPTFYLVNKDSSALEVARALLGLGKVKKHGPVFHLEIRRKAESIRLAEFLEGRFRSELRAQQFEAWRQQVLQWKSRGRGQV
jgi:hypothetical protein